MNKYKIAVISGVALILLVIFISPRMVDPTFDEALNNLEKGWVCYSTPNSLDVPGYVFRVDNNGVKFREKNFQDSITVLSGVSSDLEYVQIKKLSANMLLNLVGIKSTSANVSAFSSALVDTKITMRNNKINVIDIDDLDFIKQWYFNRTRQDLLDEGDYFVIRETISSTNMSLSIFKKALNDQTIEADIFKDIDSTIAVSNVEDGLIQFDQQFDQPVTTCIKPMRFKPVYQNGSSLSLGDAPSDIELESIDTTLLFTSEDKS